MKQVISVLFDLAEQGGGVTRVSLGRTKALSDIGLMARVALLNYDEKLDRTFQNMVAQGRICKSLMVVNFYKWFAAEVAFIRGGEPVEALPALEHLQVKVRRRVDYINSTGLRVVRYMTVGGFVFLEEFVSLEGEVVMVAVLMPGAKPLKFNSIESAHAYWLQRLSSVCLPTFLIGDSIGAADAICMVEGDGIYRILMMHSNHLLRPYVVGGAIAPKYDGVVRNIPFCDRLVVLTQGQLKDVSEQFPADRYSVIGNLIEIAPPAVEVLRESNLAVVVSRLHGVKRIGSIVSAFSKVVARNPAAKLEIWGAGENEEAIRKIIHKLNMHESIKLMGFAVDVSTIFRRASVSLGMSVTEGFGISFAESLGYGTPLVSMRTNYGPQEIVTDGVDGFIVDSEDDFVEKVNLLLRDSVLVSSMAEKGRQSAERFTSDSIVKLWVALFERLERSPLERSSNVLAEGDVMQNMISSKYGWVYLPKVDSDEGVAFYRSARRVEVVQVSSNREFLGVTTLLAVGRYEVDEMVFDEVKGRYKFRLLRGGVPYSGLVAGRSLSFILF